MVPQRLLMLNYEDYDRILPIIDNPPSGQEVVATNLRFTCWDYYDILQMYSNVKTLSMEELSLVLSKATNGNIVTLYDIANLYTKELGVKTVSRNDKGNTIDNLVEKILTQYYQLGQVLFDDWVKKATAWCDPIAPCLYGIDQSGSRGSLFARFVLSFTEEGNTLTYMPDK